MHIRGIINRGSGTDYPCGGRILGTMSGPSDNEVELIEILLDSILDMMAFNSRSSWNDFHRQIVLRVC